MPLHLLDNLSNLSDPASARSVLGLGVVNSPQFASLTTTGIISSAGPITADSTVTVWRGGGQENTNTAVGYQSLCSNSIGNNNTANGYQALYYNDTGSSNTAIGTQALFSNTDGSNNTAIGSTALINNTLGSGNIATGVTALANNTTGNNNVATGQNTLYNNAIGSYNVAIGDATLYYIAIGDNNTAIGSSAGNTISGGAINDIADTSIYLGANTKALSSGQTNQIVIGYDATGIGSNTVTLGNDSIITTALKGNVGIGTTSPNATLTVNGTLSANRISSPEYDVTGTDGMLVASKNVRGWIFPQTGSQSLSAASSPRDIYFKPDGTVVYVLGATNRRVYSFDLSTAWNITTTSVIPSLSSVQLDILTAGMFFSPNGLYMYVVNSDTDTIKRYTMPVGSEWNISLASLDDSFVLPAALVGSQSITFKPDGTKMYVFGTNATSTVFTTVEYNLITPWVVSTATVGLSTTTFLGTGVTGITITSDGTRLLTINNLSDVILEYKLPTPWSISGAFFNGSMTSLTRQTAPFDESDPQGFYYNDVANKCFFIGTALIRAIEIDVTPQPAIVGTRPMILSNQANVNDRVTMNRLQITDTTASSNTTTGALLVAGGVGVSGNITGSTFISTLAAGAGTAITLNSFNPILWSGGGNSRITGWSGRISFSDIGGEWGRFTGAQFRCANFQVGAGTDSGTVAITSPSIGILTMTGVGGDFNRIQLGGTSASFPAIKRNGTGLDITDATGLNYTSLAAGNFVVNNNISIRTDDFTLSGIDAGKYTRLAKLSGTQTITLTSTSILQGHEFTFYRATSAALALSGGTVNGGVNISSVSQNAAFGLKHLGGGIFDFI